MTDKQFYHAFREAHQYIDADAFASEDLPALAEELRHIWRYAHITVREIVQHSGLSQTDFAARFAVPLRTLQRWVSGDRDCPPYVRLLLAKQCGL